MSFHAFRARNSRANRPDIAIRITRHALPGDRLDELSDTQPARVTSRAFGRQDVVWSARLIAVSYRGFFTQEE